MINVFLVTYLFLFLLIFPHPRYAMTIKSTAVSLIIFSLTFAADDFFSIQVYPVVDFCCWTAKSQSVSKDQERQSRTFCNDMYLSLPNSSMKNLSVSFGVAVRLAWLRLLILNSDLLSFLLKGWVRACTSNFFHLLFHFHFYNCLHVTEWLWFTQSLAATIPNVAMHSAAMVCSSPDNLPMTRGELPALAEPLHPPLPP